jgi:hypothetical protein
MNYKKMSIKQLEDELDHIRHVLIKKREVFKRKELIKYVGSYFKYVNSYSCPEKDSDYWWMYLYVKGFKEGNLVCFSFQKDKYGKIVINPHDYIYQIDSLYVKCDKKEFDKEFNNIKKELRNG